MLKRLSSSFSIVILLTTILTKMGSKDLKRNILEKSAQGIRRWASAPTPPTPLDNSVPSPTLGRRSSYSNAGDSSRKNADFLKEIDQERRDKRQAGVVNRISGGDAKTDSPAPAISPVDDSGLNIEGSNSSCLPSSESTSKSFNVDSDVFAITRVGSSKTLLVDGKLYPITHESQDGTYVSFRVSKNQLSESSVQKERLLYKIDSILLFKDDGVIENITIVCKRLSKDKLSYEALYATNRGYEVPNLSDDTLMKITRKSEMEVFPTSGGAGHGTDLSSQSSIVPSAPSVRATADDILKVDRIVQLGQRIYGFFTSYFFETPGDEPPSGGN